MQHTSSIPWFNPSFIDLEPQQPVLTVKYGYSEPEEDTYTRMMNNTEEDMSFNPVQHEQMK